MIVYTAIYGGYDRLWPHVDHPSVEKWLCYTDNPDLLAPGWETIVEPRPYANPRLSAKWRKCHPPEIVTALGWGESLWVDGSVQVDNPTYIDVVADLLETADMCFVPHPDRDNIADEARASIIQQPHKYGAFDLDAQVKLYEARKGPQQGLWASTTFGRNHTPAVLQMGAAWFVHNELLSIQDQLSLPVLLDDYGITVAAIPGGLARNHLFRWRGHLK